MRTILLIAALVAAPASAEVTTVSANGFVVRHEATVRLPLKAAWERFGKVNLWWSGEHTYSGDSSRLRLPLVLGGCFCEQFRNGGGVEHLRVSYIDPMKRIVLTGALGPLLFQASHGVMDVSFARDGAATKVKLSYTASGLATADPKEMAALVDKVIGEQVARYAR